MVKAIRIHEAGGPDKMVWEDVEIGAPGPGQVLVKSTAVGLNYIDTYHRSGLYPMPMPLVLGMEGAGVIEGSGRRSRSSRRATASPMPRRSAPMPRNACARPTAA